MLAHKRTLDIPRILTRIGFTAARSGHTLIKKTWAKALELPSNDTGIYAPLILGVATDFRYTT